VSDAPGRPIPPIFGVQLHDVPSRGRLNALCARYLAGEAPVKIFTPNPEILLMARTDPIYRDELNAADLALPDGTGVALVESLLTGRRVRRWPGVELGALLIGMAAERGVTVAFVGGRDGTTERAAERWREAIPHAKIEVVGTRVQIDEDGLAGSQEAEAKLTEAVAAASPAVVLVGLGAPKQERWITRHASAVPSARILLGVGGAFDMWAGRLPRSPRVFHRLGIEWLWRLALEPRRLGRIVRATIVFPFHAITDRSSA
jgi:N-acetylglucosaminyldiphosphoundecaprenol N-acetyl-beta-D-mannosaminyltransferase